MKNILTNFNFFFGSISPLTFLVIESIKKFLRFKWRTKKKKSKNMRTYEKILPKIFIAAFCAHFNLCCASVLVSQSAVVGNTKLFEAGSKFLYSLTSTVVLNEPSGEYEKGVGYRIQGDVTVRVIWQNDEDNNEKLLEVNLKELKLSIKSRKSQKQDGFDIHKSKLEEAKFYPSLIHWKNGKIIELYMDVREEQSAANLKKAIASLFQFQTINSETKETDVSGSCSVIYNSSSQFTFNKIKTNCKVSGELPLRTISEPALGAKILSKRPRKITYKLTQDLTTIESITTDEHHEVRMEIKKEVGAEVSVSQSLILKDKNYQIKVLNSLNIENAIEEYQKAQKVTFSKRHLHLQTSYLTCDKEDCPSFSKLLKENREFLDDASLGTFKSARAFIELLRVARRSTKDEILKSFKGMKNKKILTQLCDLAGAVQSTESHEIIKKIIKFESTEDFDKSERYLWALAVGYNPKEEVIRDIFKIIQRPHSNEKLHETMLLALASMTRRFLKIPGNEKHLLVKDISQFLVNELEFCKDEVCQKKYLKALKNLKNPETIPILIKYSLNGKRKPSVEAVKGLRSFEPTFWTPEVIDAAQRIYFQAGKKYDSSCRTLALDILLESNPRREILQELLLSRLDYDPQYEVKQYLVQRTKQISEKNENFAKEVNSIKKEFAHLLNNYHVEAQRGLSTAFTRYFMTSDSRNGSLSTVMETSKGLMKRSTVDVVLENSNGSTNLFTLGLFAGGLSSLMSSTEESDETEIEEETVTAGMELSVLNSQIRPFVFFEGQGELMGHVWSGTASEKTPAFQANILVVDILNYLPLQNGFTAQLEVLGGVSFDLSGQIQISLWNRNAHSLVEKNAGISLQGKLEIDSTFVKSKVDFNLATEVKLNLQSDIDFSNGNSLCMQLSQPEVLVKHNFHKLERIPGGKHRLRKSKYIQINVPGRTYALNKKNNEMCNLIFN